MRLACSTSSFGEDRLEIAIAKVAWAGYEGAELVLDREPAPDEEELRQRLRVNNLELAAIFVGAAPAAGEGSLDELARLGRAATLARALDGSLVVVTAPSAGQLPGIAVALTALDRALGEVEVDICLVNRRGTLLASREELHALWEAGLPQRVGLALDPAQAHLAGWDPLELDALPELPRHVYLNDAGPQGVVPPGDGVLDLAGLGTELRLRGYAGSVSLALENADAWAVEPIARELHGSATAWFTDPHS